MKNLNKPTIVFLLALTAIVVIAGAVAAYMMLRPADVPQEKAPTIEELITQLDAEATKKIIEGKPNEALALYDERLRTVSGEDRASLLAEKARIASNAERHDVAVQAAEEAEREKPGSIPAGSLALIYDQAGNREKAIELYRKALGELDFENDEGAYIDKNLFEGRIAELENRA